MSVAYMKESNRSKTSFFCTQHIIYMMAKLVVKSVKHDQAFVMGTVVHVPVSKIEGN